MISFVLFLYNRFYSIDKIDWNSWNVDIYFFITWLIVVRRLNFMEMQDFDFAQILLLLLKFILTFT